MNTDIRLSVELFRPVIEATSVPTLLLDQRKVVLMFNSAFREQFFQKDIMDLHEFLSAQSVEKIYSLFAESEIKNAVVKEIIKLTTTSKKEITLLVTANLLLFEREKYFTLSFDTPSHKILSNKNTSIQVVNADIYQIIKKEAIIEIIEDIKSNFPFTFLGKEKIRNAINKLDELFWIKDSEQNYLLVNVNYSKVLGLKPIQIEGRSENNFLPAYISDFNKSLQKHINETENILIINGLAVRGFSSLDEYRTVEFSLVDAENNPVAIIGLAEKRESGKNITKELRIESAIQSIIDKLPIGIATIDSKGFFKQTNKEFCKFLKIENEHLWNKHFSIILPYDISQKLDNFLKEKTGDKFSINFNLSGENLLLELNPFSDELKEEKYFLFVQKNLEEDNFENFIKRRGPMFDVLIRSNPDPIFIYDAEDLRFLEVNEAALQLYGYSREEFLQLDLTDLYTPEDIQTILDDSFTRGKEGQFSGPYKQKRKDGNSILVEILKTEFLFENRTAHFNIVKSISDRIEQDKQLQIYKATFETTDDLIFVTDNTGIIKYVNAAVQKYLGYSKKDLIENTILSLFSDEMRGMVNSTIFFSNLTTPSELSTEIKKSEGTLLKCEMTSTPVLTYNKEIDSFTIVVKLAPQKIDTVKEIIQEKEVVKEVYVDNPNAVQGLSPTHLSTIFHELLTPLNVILGFIQEIKETIKTPSNEQKEALTIIDQNRIQLLDTMNSVSEYAQVLAKKNQLNVEGINIVSFIEDIIKEAKKGEILPPGKEVLPGKVSTSLYFNTDHDKLKTLASLILKIIGKISDEDKIYFSSFQTDDENFLLSFKDNLSGISTKLCNVFDNAIRVDDYSVVREYGLSRFSMMEIKQLLQMLNGRFQILNRSGKPNEIAFIFPFYLTKETGLLDDITLKEVVIPDKEIETPSHLPNKEKITEVEEIIEKPIEQPEKSEIKFTQEIVNTRKSEILVEDIKQRTLISEPVIKEEPALAKMSCLYIEDQVDSQILFKVQLKELQQIKFAVSFEEALPLLTGMKFDFVVMDINLQGEYNGLDALRMIRQMPGLENLPIIAVTAYVLPGDKEKFIATGFNDFISKPIFREKMIEALERIFQTRLR